MADPQLRMEPSAAEFVQALSSYKPDAPAGIEVEHG
jgi:hypothetical protein